MNNKFKLGLLIVLALSVSMMAFRPFNGDADEDGIPDQTETLAEVLGIDVETLQAAYDTAQEKALEQALADGKITQEQLDAIEEKADAKGKHGGPRDLGSREFLADALGITEEELQAAQQEAQAIMLDQALEDGTISDEEYENFQLRQTMGPYFSEAFKTARQNAIEQALADGVITEAQAESLLAGEMGFGKSPRGFSPGGYGHVGRMKPGDGFSPNTEYSDNE
jgi:hypothetical protein